MADLGYSGQYKQRTGGKDDGCATFYKTDKVNSRMELQNIMLALPNENSVTPVIFCFQFLLEETTTVEYHQPGVFCLDRDNIALILRLAVKDVDDDDNTARFVVANTHLLYNPKRQDVKLAQSVLLMAGEEKLKCVT